MRKKYNTVRQPITAIILLKPLFLLGCLLQFFISLNPLEAAESNEQIPTVRHLETMNKWFINPNGWIGGDGVYSIPFPDGRILWVFGDTFIGKVRNGKRCETTMIHNSIAIQKNSKSKPRTIIRKNKSNQPTSFFEPPDHRGYFWPFHGIAIGKSLWLFLLQIETTDSESAFGFRIVGTWLAHAVDTSGDPISMSFSLRKIPFGIYKSGESSGRTLFFGSWLLRRNDEIFIYGVDETAANRSMIVARVLSDRISNFEDWRFLCPDGWKKDFRKCRALLNGITTEFSVTTQPSAQNNIDTYVLVHSAGNLSPEIVVHTSSTIFGPWSGTKTVFICPEPQKGAGIFTYAAKAHPELSGPDGMVVSYVANAMRFEDLLESAWLYRPTFIFVPYSMLR